MEEMTKEESFRPLTGISLFLLKGGTAMKKVTLSFRPLTGISLFLSFYECYGAGKNDGFRPLTGISLFLYDSSKDYGKVVTGFSSPHGDFSFSIILQIP